MPKYILGFHGGMAPSSPEEGEKAMAKWIAWYKDMGSAVADMGNPAGPSKTIGANGRVSETNGNALTGYSILEAKDMEAALALAKGCPIYAAGGSVEVAELMPM
jgi:hypothetical protein